MPFPYLLSFFYHQQRIGVLQHYHSLVIQPRRIFTHTQLRLHQELLLHQELIQLLDSLGWAKPSTPALDLHKEKDRLRRKALIVQSKPPLTAAYSVTRAFDAFSLN